MSARHKARKAALDVLFSADMRGLPLADALAEWVASAAGQPDRASIVNYASDLVRVVVKRGGEIDALIGQVAQGWSLERMPAVDRAILRVAAAELMESPDVPTAVVIAEAGELGSEYSTEQSRGFIQGVLGGLAPAVRGE